jgi:hypothetical protein
MNANQYGNLAEGHTGGNGWGGIGGQHGAFSGLSPYATHFLSSLMEKKAYEGQSTEGLTGDALWKATLMNNLGQQNAEANPQYQLHSGVDMDFLSQLLGGQIGGHKAYEKGYGADAYSGPGGRPIAPFMPHRQRMGQGQSNVSGGIRRRPFRPGGVVRRPLR